MNATKSIAQTTANIIEKLEQRETILMIDEAEHLPVSSLKVLRRLHDFTETPVILGSTHELLKNLKGCKHCQRCKLEHDNFQPCP